ncbi:MAG: hypothetical protein LBG59_07140 [Candidatus Peribacteria bacterium]|jgi:hypothetical protein|nr:hypothetical protein [Candidatus Peribacteria bacterium]
MSTANTDPLTVDDLVVYVTGINLSIADRQLAVTLELGGNTYGPTSIVNNEVKFNSINKTLAKGSDLTFKVRGSLTSDVSTGTVNVGVKVNGTDYQGNNAIAELSSATTIRIETEGSVDLATTSDLKNSAIVQGVANQAIAQFDATVQNETLTLKNVKIIGTGDAFADMTNWNLYIQGKTDPIQGSLSNGRDGVLEITDIDDTKLAPGSYTFVVKANFGTYNTTSAQYLNLTGAIEVKLDGVNGTITKTGTLNFKHQLLKATPMIEKITSIAGNSTDVFAVKVSYKEGEDTMYISGFKIHFSGTGLSTGSIQVTDGSTIVYAGTLTDGSTTGSAIFTFDETVSLAKGQSKNFYFQAKPALSDGTYLLQLDDITYETRNGGTYVFSGLNTYANVASWLGLYNSYTIKS